MVNTKTTQPNRNNHDAKTSPRPMVELSDADVRHADDLASKMTRAGKAGFMARLALAKWALERRRAKGRSYATGIVARLVEKTGVDRSEFYRWMRAAEKIDEEEVNKYFELVPTMRWNLFLALRHVPSREERFRHVEKVARHRATATRVANKIIKGSRKGASTASSRSVNHALSSVRAVNTTLEKLNVPLDDEMRAALSKLEAIVQKLLAGAA